MMTVGTTFIGTPIDDSSRSQIYKATSDSIYEVSTGSFDTSSTRQYYNSHDKFYCFEDLDLNSDGTGDIRISTYIETLGFTATCVSPEVLDIQTNTCITSLIPVCKDNEYLDSTNVCQVLSIPSNFPDSTNSGVASIRSSGESESDCIVGKVVYSGIAYAEILGYDYATDECIVSAFFCNDGLTWNNISRTCEIPLSQTSFNVGLDGLGDFSSSISESLRDACTSGNWAKKWTYDYCGEPLCYIALDVQDYGLQCNNKYIEYDCTSDYRVKKFLQVSCGAPSLDDFSQVDLTMQPSTDVIPPADDFTPPPVDDPNATSINSAETINQLNELTNIANEGFNSLQSSLNEVSALSRDTNSKLDVISEKLNALNEGDDLLPTQDSAFDNLTNFITSSKDSLNSIESKFNETKELLNSGFTYTPPIVQACTNPSTTVYGSTIELGICEPMATFSPIFYFIFTIIFTFISVSIFILGVKI